MGEEGAIRGDNMLGSSLEGGEIVGDGGKKAFEPGKSFPCSVIVL